MCLASRCLPVGASDPFFLAFCSGGTVPFRLLVRYRPAARTKSDVDSGTSNQGFRCAADVSKTAPRSGGGGGGGGGAAMNNDGKAERSINSDDDDHGDPRRDGEL